MSEEENPSTLSSYWDEQLKSWQASGLSGMAWCRQHQVSYHKFKYWHRKLCVTPVDQEGHFVELQPSNSSISLEVNGVSIHVAPGFNHALLGEDYAGTE